MKLKVTVNGAVYDVDVEVEEEPKPMIGTIVIGGTSSAYPAKAKATSSSALTANIAGTVVKVLVTEGQEVAAGDTVLVLEAMKMETEVTAAQDGTVARIAVTVGEAVQSGQVLIEWAAEDS